MKRLLNCIRELRKTEVKNVIDCRISDFEELGKRDGNEIFKELCFCILTANFDAEKSMRIQHEIGDGFIALDEEKLAERLKELGHRFPNARANYIVEARKHRKNLKKILGELRGEELRKWLVKNVKGMWYKEVSHFLRNIGYRDYAILDFHVLDILSELGLIKRPKTLNKESYLEIEKVLRKLAKRLDMSLAELDLYLWFAETNKICK
ncbi:MAG: N-glycosylase/DNA lyase [Candidatus Aenigmarchaeota archaeon]|nr:N-glycosylase/DNA lyase [Candidatus Aenigmarchaeota archaeon]